MTGFRCHFLARHQRDAIPRGGGRKLRMMAHRVVISDRSEVETALSDQARYSGDRKRAVRVHRVDVQVSCEPAAPVTSR